MSNEAASAKDAVFVKSVELSRDEHPVVAGPDFITLLNNRPQEQQQQQLGNEAILRAVSSLGTIGFQATNLARAAQEILYMIHGRKVLAKREHFGTPLPPHTPETPHKPKRNNQHYFTNDDDEDSEENSNIENFYRVSDKLFDERIWRRGGLNKKKINEKNQEQQNDQQQQNDDDDDDDSLKPTKLGLPKHCTIFLGCTSNLFCSVVRDTICALAKDRLFDILVVSGGAFEIDIQRALDPESVFVDGFKPSSSTNTNASQQQYISYGNIKVAKNSEKYESFMRSAIPKVLFEGAGRLQEDVNDDFDAEEDLPERKGGNVVVLSPEQFWTRLARLLPEGARERSALWQCIDNGICVYSPSLADGSVWKFLREYCLPSSSSTRPRLSIDLVRDITKLNKAAVKAKRTGMIILGGGVVKHHICNANLMRNGADHSVFINSAQEFDGSDAGARPDEAISWGKIKQGSSAVKIYSEVSAVFPLLKEMTFGEVLLRKKYNIQ